MASGYQYPALNYDGTTSSTIEDFDDNFVSKDNFLTSGLYAWGYNFDGELGLGDRVHRSSPVQVGSLTNWRLVACGEYHTLAIKTDGTLWSWGHNGNVSLVGGLGLGDQVHRSSPVQVGSLTNWKLVTGGAYFSVAIKTDGTLWAWGGNVLFSSVGAGFLGLGDTINRNSPVQVGSLTNWKLVSACSYHTHAISDGSF